MFHGFPPPVCGARAGGGIWAALKKAPSRGWARIISFHINEEGYFVVSQIAGVMSAAADNSM